MRFAYADPPYYQQGKKHYGKLHDDAAKWDDQQAHIDLIDQLIDQYPDGWAMSCNPANLHFLLRPGIRVAVWCKTFHQIRPTTVQYAYEPVLFMGGRKDNKRQPMVRDWLTSSIAMKKGLVGAKPDVFNNWVLDLLNFEFGDTLDDLFPGSGGMGEVVHRRNSQVGINYAQL